MVLRNNIASKNTNKNASKNNIKSRNINKSISIQGPFVYIKQKRPSIVDIGHKYLEALEKEDMLGNLSRPYEIKVHIITSVRLMRHIKESCIKMSNEINELIALLEQINSILVKKGATSASVMHNLYFIEKKIKSKYSYEWQQAKSRLEETLEKLETNIDKSNERNRPNAAALVVSIINRLKKRHRNLQSIMSYACNNEQLLEKEMRNWLALWLQKAIEKTAELKKEIESFKQASSLLCQEYWEIDAMIENSRRERRELLKLLEKRRSAEKLKDIGKKIDSMLMQIKKQFSYLYDEVRFELLAGKPWFISSELIKNGETNIGNLIEEANRHILKGNLEEARKTFKQALALIKQN
ncbi:MAG: hypothetical protein QXS91_03690 [Candidatus Anstonellales archaeon]